jgi:8-oxo-dGTP pyrophosphatase MutT (NUDIX family)
VTGIDARRGLVRRELIGYAAVDAREARSVEAVLLALDTGEEPFSREPDQTHLTGSAIVVSELGVILHRHKLDGRWFQPGGHLERGEVPWDAALREGLEETGLAIAHPPGGRRLIHVDVHPAPHGHIHLDLRYLFHSPSLAPAPGPGESGDIRWLDWEDALSMVDDALRAGLLKARTV